MSLLLLFFIARIVLKVKTIFEGRSRNTRKNTAQLFHGLRTDRTQHSLISANCVLVRIAEYSGLSEKPTIIIILLSPNCYPL